MRVSQRCAGGHRNQKCHFLSLSTLVPQKQPSIWITHHKSAFRDHVCIRGGARHFCALPPPSEEKEASEYLPILSLPYLFRDDTQYNNALSLSSFSNH